MTETGWRSVAERLSRRLWMMVARGRITLGVDSGNAQTQQVVLNDIETRDNLPRLTEYGFHSMPPAGTDAVVVFFGGDRSNGAIIATGNQAARMRNLAVGEVAIGDDQQQWVHIKRDGIEVSAPSGKKIWLSVGNNSILIDQDKIRIVATKLEIMEA